MVLRKTVNSEELAYRDSNDHVKIMRDLFNSAIKSQ